MPTPPNPPADAVPTNGAPERTQTENKSWLMVALKIGAAVILTVLLIWGIVALFQQSSAIKTLNAKLAATQTVVKSAVLEPPAGTPDAPAAEKPAATEKPAAPEVTLPPGGKTPDGATTPPATVPLVLGDETSVPAGIIQPEKKAFRPADPDERVLRPAPAEIANGNADGSIAVQITSDAGIIYPRPGGPHHSKEAIIAAARKVNVQNMALSFQACNLEDYQLADWPSKEPLIGPDGKPVLIPNERGELVPQVVQWKVLRSPNVTRIRKIGRVPEGYAPHSIESGSIPLPPNMAPAPTARTGPTSGHPALAGGPRTGAPRSGKCPTPGCKDSYTNAPSGPFTCRGCGQTIP